MDGMVAAPQPKPLKKDDDTICSMPHMLVGSTANKGMGSRSATSRPAETRGNVQLQVIIVSRGLMPLVRVGNAAWFGRRTWAIAVVFPRLEGRC